jgi:CrcB protein
MMTLVALCTGACLGAISRWGLALWLNGPGLLLPWGTLAANLAGGWLVGLAVAAFQSMPQLDPSWRLFAITGFLGALTTFSTFSAEVVGMLQDGRLALALGTAVLHLAGSLLLTALGLKCGAWLFGA